MNQLHDDLLRKQVYELLRELCYNYYVVHELLYESVHYTTRNAVRDTCLYPFIINVHKQFMNS